MLHAGPDGRRLWQFNPGGGEITLNAELAGLPSDPLPANLIAKNVRSLWQPKLNIAWLPFGHIYLRVVELPTNDPAEARAMIELQLEKLSPLPVAQIVWSSETLPGATENSRTVIVMIVSRTLIEEFVGQLEGGGYLPDRLELPLLPQLLAAADGRDGAWICLEPGPAKTLCLAGWWTNGQLKHLTLLHLPNGAAGVAPLTDQLTKASWAGEIEGWLTAAPQWHLLADAATAKVWEPPLSQWAGAKVAIEEPLPATALASLTVQRALRDGDGSNLLPPEFGTRYRQQFLDRLWMRGLGAIVALYLVGVAGYLGTVEFFNLRLHSVQSKITGLSGDYTNAMQLKAQIDILQDQVSLRFAALNCLKAVSESLPSELTLNQVDLQNGKTLQVQGVTGGDQGLNVINYSETLLKSSANGLPLFSEGKPPRQEIRPGPNGTPQLNWVFTCELKRPEVQ